MPEFTPINAEAIAAARLTNEARSHTLSSSTQDEESGQVTHTRRSRGAESLVGSKVPIDAPTHALYDGKMVELNFDFRVKPPKSQRISENQAANIVWCRHNHAYLGADGYLQGLRTDLLTPSQELAFKLMEKAHNDQAWHSTPSVPLTVSSEAEKLGWKASLDDVGGSRDPIGFAAYLAMQTVETKKRLDTEKEWVGRIKSKQDRREARCANYYLGPLKPIEGEDSSSDDDGIIPASRSAIKDRHIVALHGRKLSDASTHSKRKFSSGSEGYVIPQHARKMIRMDSKSADMSRSQRLNPPEEVESDVSSLTDCPSDIELEYAMGHPKPENTSMSVQQDETAAELPKLRTRLGGHIEYLLPMDQVLRHKIEAEGWPTFSSNALIGSGKAKPTWRMVGERPVFSREGRFFMKGSDRVDQASQLALRFQHIERPECELIYRLIEPDWDNKETLLAWVENVQQFLRRRLGPRKLSTPYSCDEDAWLIEYAHDADVDWLAVTAGSMEADVLFKSFEEAFPQASKRNKIGVLMKVKRLLGLR